MVARQQALMDAFYRAEPVPDLAPQERLLEELVRSDHERNSGLQSYIRNMMAVMIFDAQRRGRLVSSRELTDYANSLAVAVTEAMHYFIGHGDAAPRGRVRYLAVTAAHITHMLRDTLEDVPAGYYNIPREFLAAHNTGACDVTGPAYRTWVQGRVRLARAYFKAGRANLAQVPSLRCRLAGYAYTARFESVLDAIERNDCRLQAAYPERKSPQAAACMLVSALWLALAPARPALSARRLPES
jgi:phytoene/squalene synthetase